MPSRELSVQGHGTESLMSFSQSELSKRITVLFVASYLLLILHVLDDAFIVNEAAWYGITTFEFLMGCLLIYGFIPPLGLYLTRRGNVVGLGLLLVYSFQALYGAGLNHVRHLMGDFRGSQLMNTVLGNFGIVIENVNGQGFLSLLAGMLGLNNGVPPHTHTMASNVVVFLSVGVNLVLIAVIVLALAQHFAQLRRKAVDGTHA